MTNLRATLLTDDTLTFETLMAGDLLVIFRRNYGISDQSVLKVQNFIKNNTPAIYF